MQYLKRFFYDVKFMFLHVFTKTAVLAWPFETLLQDRNHPVTSFYDDLEIRLKTLDGCPLYPAH